MAENSENKHAAFYTALAAILERFDVDLVATDDDEPYGQHSPLINIQFNQPYRSDEVTHISADNARNLAEACSDG